MSVKTTVGCFAGLAVLTLLVATTGAAEPVIEFKQTTTGLVVTRGGEKLATYMYRDDKTPRPFFKDVHVPGGIQVTRNNPPVIGKDALDHLRKHPGLWMAFSRLNGCDYWRMTKKEYQVDHVEYVEKPKGGPGKGTFAVKNRYMAEGGKVNCTEICKITFLVRPAGTLILWQSTFWSDDADFFFGDEEEMGLGIRVATPISERIKSRRLEKKVKAQGLITNSKGGKKAKACWGKIADWADYSGPLEGKYVGATIMPDPANFHASWFHARDYGFLLANPFSKNAFEGGKKMKTVVKKGEKFKIGFGVLLHAGAKAGDVDLKAAYHDYLKVIAGTEAGK